METLNDLKALLQHEVQDLMSAEDQIIEALPSMIEKSRDSRLKKALRQHLAVTKKQRTRLDRVQKAIQGETEVDEGGFVSKLKKVFRGTKKCKGIEGIITEGQKMMTADMAPAVMDAAILASAQKVEHYEICGYGTAKSYAQQLGLREVAQLLDETLNEEYAADDLLTSLAETDVNKKAQKGAKADMNGKEMAKGAGAPGKAARTKAASGGKTVRGRKPSGTNSIK